MADYDLMKYTTYSDLKYFDEVRIEEESRRHFKGGDIDADHGER